MGKVRLFMKKLITILSLATLVAGSSHAQPASPAPASVAPDAVIVSATGVSLTKAEFEDALKSLPAEYQSYARGEGKRVFAGDFLRMKLLAAAGAKAGLENDPEVTKQLALMRQNLVANAMLGRMEKGITLTDEDLQKAYEARKGEFERVKARHILVAFKGSPAARPGKPELTEEQAEAKAQELRARIVQGKATLEELAKTESDDSGSGANGGDLGEFTRGQMVAEFEKAAFEGPIGKALPVVRTQFGYHVISVDAKTTTPFAEMKADLVTKERAARLEAELTKLIDNAKPVYDPAFFGK
jgi:peptidyl-prolyl cis-trans isomerase C